MGIKVLVEHELSDEDIDDLITTMVECNDCTASWCNSMKYEGINPALTILSGRDITFSVDNPEEGPKSVKKVLNLTILKGALILASKTHPHVLYNIVEGDYDAGDADIILQLALFGEEVYS